MCSTIWLVFTRTVIYGALMLLTVAPKYIVANDFWLGEISPKSVEIAAGDSVNISCRINPEILPVCKIYFIDAETNQQVPDEDILVVNATTIIYMIRNATEQMTKYLCKCDKDAIEETRVYIGAPPRPVKDFSCRGYDFEYIVCNFTQPRNPVLTQYNLTYYIDSPMYSYDAVDACNYEGKPLVVCNITTGHASRSHVEQYHFTVRAQNTLGTNSQHFDVSYLDVIVPARPGEDFNVTTLGTNFAAFAWRMPKWEYYNRKGLQWEVLLQPEKMPALNLSKESVDRSRKGLLHLRLKDLPYAFYWYELRLRVKVQTNAASEDLWSAPFVYSFRTAARRPDRPPRTSNGSFYVNSSETVVRLYWEQLKRQEYNGDNFTYVIKAKEVHPDGRMRQLLSSHMELNSAVFEWQRHLQYAYEIRSRNHMGESLAASRIDIYPLTYRDPKTHTPRSIHNVYHATNRTYTLTWEAPVETKYLQDYTIYWCYSKRALQTECKGSVHFQNLSRDTRKFTTEPQSTQQEHTLNLAVSANYDNYNTGMHWTACTVDVNSDLVRMEPEVRATSATSIKVQWSPESVCPSILDGYNLTYCEVAVKASNNSRSCSVNTATSGESFVCTSDECSDTGSLTFTIDKNAKKFEINQLKPYTMYKVEMFMFSRMKVGKVSEPLCVFTNEAAPTPPRQLHAVEVRNTSSMIAWLPPSQANGCIRQYIVKSHNKEFAIDASGLDPFEEIQFELRNLSSYTAYKTFVIAKTIESSDHSNDIHFTTHIGYPSPVGNIRLTTDSPTHTVLQWTRPVTTSGRLEYYEVAVTLLRNDIVEKRRISEVIGGTSCVMRTPTCPDYEYKTTVEVRAVNAAVLVSEVQKDDLFNWADIGPEVEEYDGNDDMVCVGNSQSVNSFESLQQYRNASIYRLYKSAWQAGPTFGCSASRLGKITSIALSVVITSLFLVGVMFYATTKWNKMRNIKCTLPDGLDMYIAKESGGLGGNSFAVSAEKGEQQVAVSPHMHGKELHNEKHHLLASLGNDSGYLGGRSVNVTVADADDSKDTTTHDGDERMDRSNDTYKRRAHLRSESSADSLVGSTDSGDGDMDEHHTEMLQEALQLKRIAEEIEGAYVEAPISHLPKTVTTAGDSGYIKPANLATWSQVSMPLIQAQPKAAGGSGYVAVDSLPNLQIPSTSAQAPMMSNSLPMSGYVQPSALPKLLTAPTTSTMLAPTSNHGGYTTLSQLSKIGGITAPNAATQSSQLNAVPGISGYVTQRELNAFGQQQQHLY